ncbi:MAG: nucleotidyltransferase family protein [Chitinophagales bacterium]|nr:nucleotidyltransferase family protein [Chitinophagales bacterium]
MLNKQYIVNQIIQRKPDIKKFGVSKIGLFGSYVRGEQREDSDIDILIEFEKEKTTFDNFMGICFYLNDLFAGKKVEVVTTGGLSKYSGPYILKEVEYV